MNISALFKKASLQPTLRIPQLRRAPAASPATTSAQSATTVQISDEARRQIAGTDSQSTATTDPAFQLRQLVAKYDFRSITPRQMAHVAGALFEAKELSENAATSFVGVDFNLAEQMDPDKPIDMVAHFKHMQDVAEDANVREPGYFDFAVKFREEASQALRDVMSFATDTRVHVSTR